MSYWSAKDDGSEISETFHIVPHGTTTLEVVYTNNPLTVNEILRKYEGWLAEEKHRFVGLDLEYTLDQRRCAVLQLSMRKHVLVYHFVRRTKYWHCELGSFLRDKKIKFTSVDISKDYPILCKEILHIPAGYQIDLQNVFKIEGRKKAGMASLAARIIDPSYESMKLGFEGAKDRDLRIGHDFWEYKPLSQLNLRYAAIDGWVSYELYHQLMVMVDLTKHNRPPLLISEQRDYGAGEGSSIMRKRQKLWEDDDNEW